MGIFFAAAVWPASKSIWRRVAVASATTAVFVAITATAGLVFFQPCVERSSVAFTLDAFRSGAGFMGTAEYAPLGANNYELASGLPAACLVWLADTELGVVPEDEDPDDAIPAWNAAQGSCDASLSWQVDQLQHKRIQASLSHAGFLILRLRNFPAWRIAVNGRTVTSLPRRRDGLMAVAVPQGAVEVSADWSTTADVLMGRWLSALAVLLLTVLCLLERKLRGSHLS